MPAPPEKSKFTLVVVLVLEQQKIGDENKIEAEDDSEDENLSRTPIMRMLIIDDSKAMRGFLDALATELAFTTVLAEHGRDGLDKLLKDDSKEPFDIVLVDWDMPVMTGIEFVQFVRRNHDYDALKILMVTTNNTEEKITLALESGVNDFLMKPATKESLEEKLLILGVIS